MIQKVSGIVIACLSLLVLVLTVKEYQLLQVPLPKPVPLQVWLPKDAEIRPKSEVHPGTFYIKLSAAEFRDRFPAGGIVSFPSSDPSADNRVEMWKPGEGGLFWKATQTIVHPSSWPRSVNIREIKLEGMELVAYPEYSTKWVPAISMIITITLACMSVAVFSRWV